MAAIQSTPAAHNISFPGSPMALVGRVLESSPPLRMAAGNRISVLAVEIMLIGRKQTPQSVHEHQN